jgi:tol-pal system protein YbgF
VIRTTPGRAALLAWCVAAGPAAAQNREHQQQAAELRILQEQQQLLALSVAQVVEALKSVGVRVDDAGAASRKSLADLGLRVDSFSGALGSIRERTQDTDTRVRSLGDEIQALRSVLLAIQGQLTQLAQAAPPSLDPLDTSAAVPPTPPPQVTPSAPQTAGLSPSRMMASARSDYFDGRYDLALSGFEAITRSFPNSETASEAQFYIGETHFNRSRWLDAVAAYTLVIQRYPNSASVPEAYFRRGRAYDELGQADLARASWETVVKTYPETTGAILARQALERLNRKAAP